MAENKTVNLEVNSNLEQTEKAVVSLKSELRKAQAEVAALSDKFGATSKEAVEAAKRAAELKDKIGDAKSLTDAFNPDAKFKALSASLGGVASGFAAYQGALGLIGVESKEVEAQILKVQSAMAIAQGAQAVGESVDAFKQLGAVVKSYSIVQKVITAGQWLWNAAMAANPIGALVAVVVALVAAGYALVKMFIASSDATMKAEAANKALNKQIETQVKNQKKATEESDLSRDAQLKMAKASGKSAEEIRKLSVELANQEVKQKLANAQTLYAIAIEARRVAGLEDATDAQKETAEKALKAYNDANDALKASVLNRRKLLIDNRVAERQEETDAEKKRVDDRKKASDAAEEKAKAKREQDAKDLLEFNKSVQQGLNDLQIATNNAQFEQRDLDIQNKKDQALQLAEIGEEITKNEEIENNKRMEMELAVAEGKKAIQESTFAVAESGISLLKGLFEKNKAIQKGLLLAESAVGLAKIVVSTQAANAADTAYAATMGPAGAAYLATKIPLNYISAGIGAAANIAATAKALSALGGGGSASKPSMGGGAAGGGQAAPQFNVVGNSGVNQLAQTLGGQSEQAPIQAFVVAQDVTTAQGLNRNIVTNASLG
jgi:hypothetical protein